MLIFLTSFKPRCKRSGVSEQGLCPQGDISMEKVLLCFTMAKGRRRLANFSLILHACPSCRGQDTTGNNTDLIYMLILPTEARTPRATTPTLHQLTVGLQCSSVLLFVILNIIWRETKARLSTQATQKSKMAGSLVGVVNIQESRIRIINNQYALIHVRHMTDLL